MSLSVEFHPRLMEEAVWLAMHRQHPEGMAFDRERAAIYGEPDPEARHAAFTRFFAAWFRRLGLDSPVRDVLTGLGESLHTVERCLVGTGGNASQLGVELFVDGPSRRTIVISIDPGLLNDRGAALEFLRRELTHVSDMLDPDFNYEPRLPRQAAGPAHDGILQERYRVLWNCSVDGRLVRRGELPESAHEERLIEFRHYFACLEARMEICFERLFTGPRPSHPKLVNLARDPEVGFGLRSEPSPSSHRCPLCGFPTVGFEPLPESLSDEIVRAIRDDFPNWASDAGLCRQCADLYRARVASSCGPEVPGNIVLDPAVSARQR